VVVQNLLDEADMVVTYRDRKARKKLFRAIQDGDFYDFDGSHPCISHTSISAFIVFFLGGKGQGQISPELQQRREKNRLTKAQKKRLRRQAMLEEAADPFSVKRAGKKSRKLIRAAAKLESSSPIPNRTVNASTVVDEIRRFAADIGGRSSMALPPMDKHYRKQVHEIASAFNLKSQSKGKGSDRYTTLWRTTRTGLQINEKKIARCLGISGKASGSKQRAADRNPRPKEGDEVGKVCTI
jgi:hypothetical protein